MKKVALLGDSIRQIGYGTVVPGLLGDEYEVFQPKENCRFAKYTLRMLYDYRKYLADCQVIHWNNGLWDTCALFGDGVPFTREDEYVSTMLSVADKLKAITPHIIFATITPVRKENPHNRNSVIERYNALLVPELKSRGIVINDLYGAVSQDIERYIREDDKIHLSQEGIDLCAGMVAQSIRQLGEL